MALGGKSEASGEASVALGGKSEAGGKASVALGSRSEAPETLTVSVGSNKLKRRIVNIEAGTGDFDAVNKAQLDAQAAEIADLKQRVTALMAQVAKLASK